MKKNRLLKNIVSVIPIIALMLLTMSACAAQQVTPTETVLPTTDPVPPTPNPPTATPEPTIEELSPIFPPDTPGLVTSLDEIVGKWFSRCGGGNCYWEFRLDGGYKVAYDPPSETGITTIDGGSIAISGSIIHLYGSTGCGRDQDGYYQAVLATKEEELYLTFTGLQPDECVDRYNAIAREMPVFK